MLRIQTLLLWSRDAQSSVPKIRRALHGLQHVEVTWCHLHTSLVAGFCSACWNHPITYYKVSFKLDLVLRLKTKFDDGKSPFAAYSRLFIKLNVSFKFVEGKPDFSVYYAIMFAICTKMYRRVCFCCHLKFVTSCCSIGPVFLCTHRYAHAHALLLTSRAVSWFTWYVCTICGSVCVCLLLSSALCTATWRSMYSCI